MTTADRKFVKPRSGLLIRDEYTLEHIPPDGAEVKVTRHIARRIMDGDLIECEQPTPPATNIARKGKTHTESEG